LIRPDDLPDFERPPIIEAVMSVQFTTPVEYREIYARDVWALFEKQFPRVEEQLPLPASFEVFGAPGSTGLPLKIEPMTGPLRNRYWFLVADGRELIQFQHDRFVHNWRKMLDAQNEYPRFEPILEKFESELGTLDGFFQKKGWGPIAPNQCELTYVNRMPLINENGEQFPLSLYFRKMDMSLTGDATDFALRLQQVITDSNGNPIGRLYIDTSTQADTAGRRQVALTLTARGQPEKPTIPAVVAFLQTQRERIVRTFTEFTSDAAHEMWGRTQ